MREKTTAPTPQRMPVERHPLEPFLPPGARILMLGSFPPPRTRWSMEFYYPNFQNDMWRICGLAFHGDKAYFEIPGQKRFDRARVAAFCAERGIALYDTATAVRRLKENAADQFLEVVEPTDVGALLRRLPDCQAVVVTGEKAAGTVLAALGLLPVSCPGVGGQVGFEFDGRQMRLYRMPSSSRAYPLALARKAAFYGEMFRAERILPAAP